MIENSYISFWLKSTNKHGVHSPFVYRLITEGFTTKAPKYLPKIQRDLWKLISYFNWKSVGIHTQSNSHDQLVAALDLKIESSAPLQIFDCNSIKIPVKEWLEVHHFSSNTCIFIEGIHQSAENRNLWMDLIQDPQVIVSIDAFRFGLLFFRKEQLKEHFILRV